MNAIVHISAATTSNARKRAERHAERDGIGAAITETTGTNLAGVMSELPPHAVDSDSLGARQNGGEERDPARCFITR
jgi:hypothetical protein